MEKKKRQLFIRILIPRAMQMVFLFWKAVVIHVIVFVYYSFTFKIYQLYSDLMI